MKELQKLIENGENYLQYKPIHAELKKLKNDWTNKRDKYEEAHRAELTLWNAASRYLHANLTDIKMLPISKWKQEYADLKEQRDTDYTKLKATRAEVAELQKKSAGAWILHSAPTSRSRHRTAPSGRNRSDKEKGRASCFACPS